MWHTTNVIIAEMRCFTASALITVGSAAWQAPFQAARLPTSPPPTTSPPFPGSALLRGSGHGLSTRGSGLRALRLAANGARIGGSARRDPSAGPLPREARRIAASNKPGHGSSAARQPPGSGNRQGGSARPPGRSARGAEGGGAKGPGESHRRVTVEGSSVPARQQQRRQEREQPREERQRRPQLDAQPGDGGEREPGDTSPLPPRALWARESGRAREEAADASAEAGAQSRGGDGAERSPPPPPDPLLGLLLQIVRPLDEAGFAYCAVRRTAAWLHGVALPLRCRWYQRGGGGGGTGSSSGSSSSSRGGSSRNVVGGWPCVSGAFADTSPQATEPVLPPPPPQRQHSRAGQGALPGGPAAVTARAGAGHNGCDAEWCSDGSRCGEGQLAAEAAAGGSYGVPELELEVQWDQMKTLHEQLLQLLAPGGAGAGAGGGDPVWRISPLKELPGGTATFTLTAPLPPTDIAVTTSPNSPNSPNSSISATAAPLGAPQPRGTATAAEPPSVDGTSGSGWSSSMGPCSEGPPDRLPHPQQPPAPPLLPPPPPAAPPPPSVAKVYIHCTYNTTLRARPDRLLLRPCPPPLSCILGGGGDAPGEGDRRGPGLAVMTAASGRGGPGAYGARGQLWSQSLHSVGVEAERAGDWQLVEAVRGALRSLQRELSAANTAAWGRDTAYDAWVARFGAPQDAAARLLRDPGRCLGPLLSYITLPDSPPLVGLRVANLCGSHGHKAVALAALGSRVTVVDASAGNAAYAMALAEAAGLADAVSYIVGDVAELRPGGVLPPPPPPAAAPSPSAAVAGALVAIPAPPPAPSLPLVPGPGGCQFDLVVMEMGVLHYFLDLGALMRDVVAPLLRPGGRLLLREFHPVSTKLLASRGKKHKVTGDYFATQPLTAVDVAYSKYEDMAVAAAAAAAPSGSWDPEPGPAGEAASAVASAGGGGGRPTAFLRRWGLGEVVSSVCSGGLLAILCLDEEPGPRLDDAGMPKVFTLLAERRV